jgi:hypothetical protein
MSEIKYTEDGNKVLMREVIANNQYLVSKIILIGEEEVAATKCFVVDTLYDEKPLTWYEKNEREQKAKYDESIKKIEKEFRQVSDRYENQIKFYKNLSETMKWEVFTKHNKGIDKSLDFYTGKVKYLIVLNYTPSIEKFPDILNEDGEVKMLSLFGRPNNIHWVLHEYSDGSGNKRTVIPCYSYKDATEKLTAYLIEQIKTRGLQHSLIDIAKKYKLKFTKEIILQYSANLIQSLEVSNQNSSNEMLKKKEYIASNNKLIKKLKQGKLR